MGSRFSDPQLEAYLEEALPPDRMAEVETALRDDPDLAQQLASIIGRHDAGVHSLGGVWRRARLSCLSREQLGSLLLGVLDPGLGDYARFHLETIGCRYCTASLEDLQGKTHPAGEADSPADDSAQQGRRQRYFQSSAGLLRRIP